jgi:hypothetical protein
MSECNGFKLRGLNADCNRVAVKSTHQSSWQLPYKTHVFSRPKEHDVAIHRNELVVMTYQDYLSGRAEIEITPLGDKVGTLLLQSSRNARKTLRVGQKYRFTLEPGESVTLRNSTIIHPTHDAPRVPV